MKNPIAKYLLGVNQVSKADHAVVRGGGMSPMLDEREDEDEDEADER